MKKYLLAPWRNKYISSLNNNSNKSCVFCNAILDKDAPILKKGKYTFIIINIFPYNPGHIMITPYRHIGDYEKLNKSELNEMMDLSQKSTNILKKIMNPHGFNLGINVGKSAGAGFADHIHLHIVPRWQGDDNFMSVISDIKVISSDPKQLFQKLKKEFRKI